MTIQTYIQTLPKDEIVKRALWRCPLEGHSKHNGLEHPSCYERLKDVDTKEKIGFLDIECEDLKADYGVIFCYALKDRNSKKIYSDILTLEDIKKGSSRDRNIQPKEDARLIQSLIKDMKNFTRIVTHFGSIFDLPYVRTRATICKIDYPSYGAYVQTDTWRILRNKFKLSRNSLENSHLKLLGFTRKDHLSLSIKHGCLRGEKWAIDLTMKHCIQDVLDTEELYNLICPFVKQTKASI